MEDELEVDKAKHMDLAIQKITEYCSSARPSADCHDDNNIDNYSPIELQRIHNAIYESKDDRLVGEILSGASNYTYKIFLRNDQQTALFVKVALTYALWNPDRSAKFSLDRLSNERKMMSIFRKIFASKDSFDSDDPPVCYSYFIMDISPEARMLVNRFEQNQSTLHFQFIKGTIDRRILPKVAEFMATINSHNMKEDTRFPPDYNNGIKETFCSVCQIFKAAFPQVISEEQPCTELNQQFLKYARNLGQETFNKIVDNMLDQFKRQEVLLHGDCHVINMLVEDMNEGSDVSFGPKGNLHVCDWDMSHVGSRGRDIGTFFAFPIAASYFLAVKGQAKKAHACIDSAQTVWDEYYKILTTKIADLKTEAYMLEVYRSCMGWCGLYVFGANVILKVQLEHFPFNQVSEQNASMVMASYALTGLKVLEYGFLPNERGKDFTLTKFQNWFRDTVNEQIDFLAKNGPKNERKS